MTKPKTPLKRDQIIAALHACGGGVYLAAKQLGCAPTTIYRRMERDAKLAAVVEGIRGELVDIAEAGLRRKALEGDTTALIWITKTLGKSRGYVERQELTGADGTPVTIKVVYGDDGTGAGAGGTGD